MKNIILASASPRRADLLKSHGVEFTVITADVDERQIEKNYTLPKDMVSALSFAKAKAVFDIHPDSIVIGADTCVALNDNIFGKPQNEKDAFGMLSALSGKRHSVFTGVTILSKNKKITYCVETGVVFNNLSDTQINDYISTKEPMDKAGAYGIQGKGKALVSHFEGDYENIVGLPSGTADILLKIAKGGE